MTAELPKVIMDGGVCTCCGRMTFTEDFVRRCRGCARVTKECPRRPTCHPESRALLDNAGRNCVLIA